MEDSAVIQLATIYEIGDAIIDTAGTTEDFTLRDVPRLIREDVYNKGYADGEANGTGGYDNGYADGRQAEHKEFWDAVLDPSLNWQQRFTGAVWNDATFRPNQDIKPTGYANNLFYLTAITDLDGILQRCGVTLDTSGIDVRGDRLFYYCTKLTTVPYIDLSNVTYSGGIGYLFGECYDLHTVVGLRLRDDGSLAMDYAFYKCDNLVNLTIYGTIGKNVDLRDSTKLSKDSITSVMNALSTTTSGLSITLSKTAVNNAFPSDGEVPNAYWEQLVREHSNWTINLV